MMCVCAKADLLCIDISGVPGTGKTATVYAIVRELKRMAEEEEVRFYQSSV
jgi:Cdc6-like AAA superfamily ATPase